METVRIDDVYLDPVEVSVKDGGSFCWNVVRLNFDPDDCGDCHTIMQYSPDQARRLAAALILAAEEVEAEDE